MKNTRMSDNKTNTVAFSESRGGGETMKKFIVIGIIAMMVMGLAVTAMADATALAVFLRASTDTAGKLGSYGTFQAGTKGTATDAFVIAEGDAYFSSTLSDVAAVFAPSGGGDVSKDFRAPITSGVKTWNLTFGGKNAAAAGYLSMWNTTAATADVPSNMSVILYSANAAFVKGAPVFSMNTSLNGNWTSTAGYTGDFYQTNAFGNYVLEVGQVPEPGSMVAMFSGLVGLVGYGIRRRK